MRREHSLPNEFEATLKFSAQILMMVDNEDSDDDGEDDEVKWDIIAHMTQHVQKKGQLAS